MNPYPIRGLQPASPDAFGLIAWLEETRIALPLKAVDVDFSVNGDLAEVTLDQIFHQTARRSLDVLYTFPLPAGAAVYRCELIVNDRVIQARVEEQGRARQIAREMKAAGHRTGLVEMERDNIFTLSLGNVQPNDLIVVRFAWFQVLDHAQDAKSLSIPFTPGVRYIPGKPLLRSNSGKGTQDDTDQVPNASRISPPRIDELHPDAALISLSGKMDARFVEPGSVSSATHPLLVRDEENALRVTLPLEGHVPDRDFVLRWKERKVEALDLKSISCVDDDSQYAVVRLDAPSDVPVTVEKSRDYYFLVDRSGSMGGAKWTCTARALNAFVDELADQDRVWVTLFESTFQDYAEAPLPVAGLKNDPAFRSLEKVGVDGGTELLPALKHVLEKIKTHSKGNHPAVIIITDGQMGNEAGVMEALRAHRDLPIHTFGIDTAVNDAFLTQLAAEHRGACMLMTPNDDIQGAVSRLGNRLRRPVLTEVTVSGGWEGTASCLPDVHAGEHILVALKGPRSGDSLTLTGKLADQTVSTFRFDLKPQPIASPRLLWAKQAIARCQAENRRHDAIALAQKHNIICRGAAFIAYDLKEKVSLATEEIYQPAMVQPAMVQACAMAAAPAAVAPGSRHRSFAGSNTQRMSLMELASGLGEEATSGLSHLATKTRKLLGSFNLKTDPSEKLKEICSRHLATSKRLELRTQILVDTWSQRAQLLPVFQSEAGLLLKNLLRQWATTETETRISLLNQLIDSLPEPDALKKFINQNITDSKLATDMTWLAANLE